MISAQKSITSFRIHTTQHVHVTKTKRNYTPSFVSAETFVSKNNGQMRSFWASISTSSFFLFLVFD